MVFAYPGVQDVIAGFPYPKYGSYEALCLDRYTCTTRASRLGAYGCSKASADSTTNGTVIP
ncbi:hypothetical protein BDW68DRAFT_153697 [Aspergillus falconensis]